MNSPQGLFGNLVQNQLGFSRTTIGRSLGNLNTLQENKNKNATKQNLKNLELEKKEPHCELRFFKGNGTPGKVTR